MKLILIENIFDKKVSNGRLYDTIEFLEKEMRKVENVKPLKIGDAVILPNNAEVALYDIASKVSRFLDKSLTHPDLDTREKEGIEKKINRFENKLTTELIKERLVVIKELLSDLPFLWSVLTRLGVEVEPHEVIFVHNYYNIKY